MTHCTLVYVIETNFHKIDASGQLFTSHSVMLEHAVVNPEGPGKDFSHFFPPGYYLNVIPMTKLAALAADDTSS
jgi:hypothetical protein